MDGLYPIIRRVRRPLVNMATKQRPATPSSVLKPTPTSAVENASAVPVADARDAQVISDQVVSVQIEAQRELRPTNEGNKRHGRKAKEA
ncbi:hypothetical protein GC207_12850 [bacterium]|nr:hypothetical protein [bacterium]